MNSMQRLQAAVQCQPVDRTPVIPQIFGHAAMLAGVPLADYLQDGGLLSSCQLQAWRRYGGDTVFALMDVNVEAEAAGAALRYPGKGYPFIERHALTAEVDPESLTVPDPGTAGRMPELLRAAELLRQELVDETPVTGCVLGPMTLAVQLLGLETALYMAVDDPLRFEALLDHAADIALSFGLTQLQAGVHVSLVFDPSSSPEVVPAQFFRELLVPRFSRLFSAFAEAGATACWLHVTGQIGPVLPLLGQTGAHIVNFDYCVDAAEAMQQLPHTCLDGNVTPYTFVEGSPADIAAASADLLQCFSGRNGFILSSGCEIPPEARPENIAAMVAAVHVAK